MTMAHRTGRGIVAAPSANRLTARAIASAFGLDPDSIQGKTTAELGQGAPRPLNGGLLAPRLNEALPGVMRPLAEALADFRAKVSSGDVWADPMTA